MQVEGRAGAPRARPGRRGLGPRTAGLDHLPATQRAAYRRRGLACRFGAPQGPLWFTTMPGDPCPEGTHPARSQWSHPASGDWLKSLGG